MIYFMYDYDRDLIKIGFTENMPCRLRTHRNKCKTGLRVIGVMPGGKWEERSVLNLFEGSAKCMPIFARSREWYFPTIDMLRFIEKFTVEWRGEEDFNDKQNGSNSSQSWHNVLSRLAYRGPIIYLAQPVIFW